MTKSSGQGWLATQTELQSRLLEAPTSLLESCSVKRSGHLDPLTHAMMLTWLLDPALQVRFNLEQHADRLKLKQWCERRKSRTRGLVGQFGRLLSAFTAARNQQQPALEPQLAGANLVGYGRGVLGMGEHVRMVARAMQTAGIPYGLVDFHEGLGNRVEQPDPAIDWQEGYIRGCNIMHVNADQMVRAYWTMGPQAFRNRYTIGYWAWELSRFPQQWHPAIGFVDEIWAPSRFIQSAIGEVTQKPVVHMPLCVELSPFERLPRAAFGLEEDECVFAFSFDCHSYITRKNPQAVVRAFKQAFPNGERARLVIKAMNSDVAGRRWDEFLRIIGNDPRITVFDATWPKDKLLALINAADCYVSLHRSEGFGRGPAEAMLLNKIVISTDYSGTCDYCTSENSLLVKSAMTGLSEADYPFGDGQHWAEPDIRMAAEQMGRVFDRTDDINARADKGRREIEENFSKHAIGRRYQDRLAALNLI